MRMNMDDIMQQALNITRAQAGVRPMSASEYRGCLIKTKINEAINYFRDEASGYL